MKNDAVFIAEKSGNRPFGAGTPKTSPVKPEVSTWESTKENQMEHANAKNTAEDGMTTPDVFRKEPRIKIVIDEQENHEGARDVRLGINGHILNIQRGKVVEVPESFIHVLEDSKYTVIYKDEHGEDTQRDVPRFNWRRVA